MKNEIVLLVTYTEEKKHSQWCSKIESKTEKNAIIIITAVLANFVTKTRVCGTPASHPRHPRAPQNAFRTHQLQSRFCRRSERLIGPSNPVTTLQDYKTNIPHSMPPFCSYFSVVLCSRVGTSNT